MAKKCMQYRELRRRTKFKFVIVADFVEGHVAT